MIKLIALDFDYTLVDYLPGKKPMIEEKALRYFNHLAVGGIQIGIVTGRRFDGFEDVLKGVGRLIGSPFPSFLITSDSYLYTRDEKGVFVQKEDENRALSENIMRKVETILPHLPECIDRLRKHGLLPVAWNIDSGIGVTLEMRDPDKAQRGLDLLEGGIDGAEYSRNCSLLHIKPNGENKGTAVLRFSNKLGIRCDEVLAVGDSLNDLSMLDGRYGFLSGTPANGDAIVKSAVIANRGYVSEYRASSGTADCIRRAIETEKARP